MATEEKIGGLFMVLRLRNDVKAFATANKLLLGLGGLATAIGAKLSLDIFTGAVDNATQRAGELADTSQRFGVGIEALQELDFAAKMSGGSLDDLKAGFRGLALNLQDLSKADSPIRDVLKTLQISAKDPALSTIDGAFTAISEKISALPDGAQKTALAMKAFGKGGLALIPLLNEGPKGLASFRAEARDLGIVASAKEVQDTDALGDNIDKLKMSVGALRDGAVRALVPALSKAVTGMIAWVKTNRALITSSVVGFFKAAAFVVTTLASAIKAVIVVGAALIDNWKAVITIVTSLTAAVGLYATATIAAGLASAAAGAKAALAWAAAAAPLLILAAKIAIVIAIVEDLYQWVSGGESVFEDLYWGARHWLTDKIGEVVDGLKNTFGGAWATVKEGFQGVWDWIEGVIAKILGTIRGVFDKLVAAKDAVFGASLVEHAAQALAQQQRTLTPGASNSSTSNTQNNTQNNTLAPVININSTNDYETAKKVQQAIDDSWRLQMTRGGWDIPR